MANARNEFIRTSDTLSSHFADFFLEYFILWGIFFQNRGKNILFGEGNGAEFRPQKQQKKNTPLSPVPWTITCKCHVQRSTVSIFNRMNYFFSVVHLVVANKNFQRKIVYIFSPITFSICFGCSKEPSH